jgi:signal transduction histidine kinase
MGTDQDPAWERWARPRSSAAQQRQDLWLGLAVVALSLLVTVLVNSAGYLTFGRAPGLPEQFAWTVAMTVPLMVRTRFPLPVLFVVGALFIAAQVRQIGDNLVPSIALFLAIYTVGAWCANRTVARWSRVVVIVAMFSWLGVGLVKALTLPPQDFPGAAGPLDPLLAVILYQIVFNLLYFVSAYFFGSMAWLSQRRRAQLEHSTAELRRSQERNTQGAVIAERVRIARDLHDVVAHHVSVMGVQAGAARRVLARDPDTASDALRAVEETARVAIGELRGLLGVLRADEPGMCAPPEPASEAHPGLAQLPDLLSTARSAGLEVDYGVFGDERPVPDGVALSAYRVAQEALTNVVKHAGARKVDVRVRYLADSLEVEITDDGHAGPVSGTGFGLLGMRERVAVHGGELEVGPRRDGYRVRAALPTGTREETS